MADEAGDQPDLSLAEWQVMKVVWRFGPMAARDVSVRLAASGQRWSRSTVKTLLGRMVRKRWLTYEQIGNSYLYRPAVAQERAVLARIRKFANHLLDGVASPFVAYLATENGLTPEDIGQLRRIVKRHGRRGTKEHDAE